MKKIIGLLFLGVIIFFSCSPNKFNTEQECMSWINDVENGLIQTKSVAGIKITVKMLPPEIIVYNELKNSNYSKKLRDSLLRIYSNNRTFILTLSPDKDEDKDVLYYQIKDEKEFTLRLNELNFNIANYIQIKSEKNIYLPVLHTFENTYGISPYRSIYLVFAKNGQSNDDLLTSKKLELVFNDLLFNTGISYFSFKNESLINTPNINFWKR